MARPSSKAPREKVASAGGAVKVGFTGTQSELTPPQVASLRALLERLAPTEIHHGDCVGADAAAHAIAKSIGLVIVVHPPSNPSKRAWCTGDIVRPPRAYLDRNRDLVAETDLLVACPWQQEGEAVRSGIWATVRHARRLARRIYIVRPDGRVETDDDPPQTS